jgi:secernin
VNDRGVAVGNETIYTTLDPRGFPPALTGMDLVRLALERAGSASAAVAVIADAIERYGQGGSGHRDVNRPYWSSFLVADPQSAFVVETSGRTVATEQVGTVRAISNRTTIPAFDAEHRHPRQPVERLVDPRLAASRLVLSRPPIGAGELVAHLRSHEGGDDGWTVCMHVDGVEQTTASLVAELPPHGPAVAWCSLGSPCEGSFTRVVVGDAVPPSLGPQRGGTA